MRYFLLLIVFSNTFNLQHLPWTRSLYPGPRPLSQEEKKEINEILENLIMKITRLKIRSEKRNTGIKDQSISKEDTTKIEDIMKRIIMKFRTGKRSIRGGDQQKKVGLLSGGERNRVHLAKMLRSGANLLLLDEPTNDLDVETLRALEEGLEDFPGCAVIISHDRWFLDRLATHILAFEGDSHVEWFEGSYSDYEVDRKVRLGTDAEVPKRIKYKQFSR